MINKKGGRKPLAQLHGGLYITYRCLLRAPSPSPAGKSNIAEGVRGGEGRAFNLVLHLQGPDGLDGDDL